MKWLRRIRSETPDGESPGEVEDPRPGAIRRAAPALAAVFEGLSPEDEHTVLDLGTATQAHLRLYGRYSRRIRFAGLLPVPPRGADFPAALRELKAEGTDTFDVVLLWNVLDWLAADQRTELIERLSRITSAGCRLYAVVDPSDGTSIQPVRFTPLDVDRVAQEPVGRPVPVAGPPLLPARVRELLEPFRITRAFTLRLGQREYAAVKGESPG